MVGGMHVWGKCMAVGGMHAQGGHAWQGSYVSGGGRVWPWGVCMEGACMPHPPPPQPDTTRYGRSMSGRYASYWNAFLFNINSNNGSKGIKRTEQGKARNVRL